MGKTNEERISSEVCSLNFSFLTHTYGKSHSVRAGKKVLNQALSNRDINLTELLRHHDQKKIRGIEALHRKAVDDLLSFYSIIEIAALIGYIRPYPIGPQLREVQMHLGTPSLLRYYREYYPLSLPLGLLARLQSKQMPNEYFELPAIFPKFISFLLLSQQMSEDKEITAFFSWLDNGCNKAGHKSLDIISLLSDTEKLRKVVGLQGSRGAHYRDLRGFANFIAFSIELDDFLQSISEFPLFQSACYQYHKDRYMRFGKQLTELTKAVLSILSDDPFLNHNTESRLTTPEYESGVFAIDRLISCQYAEHYERVLQIVL